MKIVSSDDRIRPVQIGTEESPQRWESPYKGSRIRVHLGWNVLSDDFIAHAYVVGENGKDVKVPLPSSGYPTARAARDAAFEAAARQIDAGSSHRG
ncbi:hypothetical protein SAMN04489709_13938 [Paracidovorax citrulli]|nr:hypothetical protein SAMN04489709_13938 [Paracidovorax citrulli]